jgi:peptide/nickel transport system permease protein
MALADFAWHVTLPALALMLSSLAIVSRMMRSSMLETLSQPYIVTVRAFGLRNSTITYKYALKNALIPTLTAAALAYGYSIVGDFVVETIFDWPGVGSYAVGSLVSLDFPAILGTTLVVAMAYIAINLIVDFLYVIIDPRIRYE